MRRDTANHRLLAVLIATSILFAFVSAGVYSVAIAGAHLYSQTNIKAISDEIITQNSILQSDRGVITDRNGNIIAQDVDAYSVYAVVQNLYNNTYVIDKESTARALEPFLNGLTYDQILATLNTADTFQVYFGENGKYLTLDQRNQLLALNLPGIGFDEVVTRNYPNGTFASNLIGYAQYDEVSKLMTGKMGLEESYNSTLQGTNGYEEYQADASGYQLPQVQVSKTDAVNGNNVKLTIDKGIQDALEKAMQGYLTDIGADAMWGGVMDVATGKMLAYGQAPSFDPNNLNTLSTNKTYEDYMSQWTYEPGSTMKTFTYAAAIDSGNYNGNETFDSSAFYVGMDSNGNFYRSATPTTSGGGTITNAGGVNYGNITYDKGYVYSSNVGVAEMMLNKIPYATWKDYIKRFGFLQSVNTAESIPESDTIISDSSVRDQLSVGFGQGITVNALQMFQAYSAIFNDGIMVKPYFVESITDSKTNEVLYQGKTEVTGNPISAATANQMVSLMYRVANDSDGTGRRYLIDEVPVVAKTGTGQVVVNGQYSSNYYTYSAAIGMPADNPQVMIYFAFRAYANYNMDKNADKIRELERKVALAYNLTQTSTSGSTQISMLTMDSYVNQSLESVLSALTPQGVQTIIIGSKDTVMAQYPAAGQKFYSNQRIFLVTQTDAIALPSFTGYSYKDILAFKSITGLNLVITGNGYVKTQSVAAGTVVDPTVEIDIVLN